MDKRLSHLRISFPHGWRDISRENPDGPPTFLKDAIDNPGVLQISTAKYVAGKVPNPSYEVLVGLSKKIGLNYEARLEREESGKCGYGIFGMAQFSRADFPHMSVWHLSDGKNFVMATFICSTIPDHQHLGEARRILMGIRKKSFWEFFGK